MTDTFSPLAGKVANDVLGISDFLISAERVVKSDGAWNDYGEYVAGEETRTAIQVAMIPGTKNREVLPEGLEGSELITLYWHGQSDSIKAGQADGDVFIVNERRYQAIMVERWGAYSAITASLQE